jgi:hypothetical protein
MEEKCVLLLRRNYINFKCLEKNAEKNIRTKEGNLEYWVTGKFVIYLSHLVLLGE